jgi:hypothetical protein
MGEKRRAHRIPVTAAAGLDEVELLGLRFGPDVS